MTIWSSEIKELEKLQPSVREVHPKLDKELSRLIRTDDENMALNRIPSTENNQVLSNCGN